MSADQAELIFQLELRLSDLAMEWRSLPEDKIEESKTIVENYQSIMDQLWVLGWDGRTLPLDSHLPDELMPKYFLDYWQRK
jgi:hypothetical protein